MKRKFLFSIFLFVFSLVSFSQKHKPFSGTLTYRIELINAMDTSISLLSFTTLFTNDTLVRIDTESEQFGPQVLIKHMELRKYYLLLAHEGKKYAIQQTMPADTSASKYSFKKMRGKVSVAGGLKAKRILVNSPTFPKPIIMAYLPKVSPKYLDILDGIPGLPVDYYIQTETGFLHYILEKVDLNPVPKTTFTIPHEFEKISFDDFMDRMMQGQ